MMIKRGSGKLAALGLGAMIAGTMLAGASSAVAAEGTAGTAAGWGCPEDAKGCLWDGRSGDGDVYVVRDCGEYDLPDEWRDRTSSYQIMSAYQLRMYDYRDGEAVFMESLYGTGRPPGQGKPMTEVPDNDNKTDRISVRC